MHLSLITLLDYLDDVLEPGQARAIGQKVGENDRAQEVIARIHKVTRRRPNPEGPEGEKLDANTVAEYLDNALNADHAAQIEKACLASDGQLAEVAACHQILTLMLGEAILAPPTAQQRMYGLVRGPEAIPYRRPQAGPRIERSLPLEEEADEILRLGLPYWKGQGKTTIALFSGVIAAALALLVFALWQTMRDIPILPEPPLVAQVEPTKKIEKIQDQQPPGRKPGPEKGPSKAKKETPEQIPPPVRVSLPMMVTGFGSTPEEARKDALDQTLKAVQKLLDENKLTSWQPTLAYLETEVLQGPGQEGPPEGVKKTWILPLKSQSEVVEGLSYQNQLALALKVDPKIPVEIAQEKDTGAPSGQQVAMGHFVPGEPNEKSMLLEWHSLPGMKGEWKRLMVSAEIISGRPLLSLPGFRSTVQLKKGIRLGLWGQVPEIWPVPPVLESLVELHAHAQFDLDMTLRRGRIVLASESLKPLQVRVRFPNPSAPSASGKDGGGEYLDLTLLTQESQVLIDTWSLYPPEVPFFRDPQAKRPGPTGFLSLLVLDGRLKLQYKLETHSLEAPPGRALVTWDSHRKLNKPITLKAVPDGVLKDPPGMEKFKDFLKARSEFEKGRDGLAFLGLKPAPLGAGLEEALKPTADLGRRVLAVRCLGALDDISRLVRMTLADDAKEVRQATLRTLQHWIALDRDHDYLLWEELKSRYTTNPQIAEKIMELMHGYQNPDLLIDYLDNKDLVIRELAAMNLYSMIPAGQGIAYNASDPSTRISAQNAWRKLLRDLKNKK